MCFTVPALVTVRIMLVLLGHQRGNSLPLVSQIDSPNMAPRLASDATVVRIRQWLFTLVLAVSWLHGPWPFVAVLVVVFRPVGG